MKNNIVLIDRKDNRWMSSEVFQELLKVAEEDNLLGDVELLLKQAPEGFSAQTLEGERESQRNGFSELPAEDEGCKCCTEEGEDALSAAEAAFLEDYRQQVKMEKRKKGNAIMTGFLLNRAERLLKSGKQEDAARLERTALDFSIE